MANHSVSMYLDDDAVLVACIVQFRSRNRQMKDDDIAFVLQARLI